MTFKPITVASLVALAWIALVAFYVLNGLGPHGYIDGTADAVGTALIWLVAGGLAWAGSFARSLPILTGRVLSVGWVRPAISLLRNRMPHRLMSGPLDGMKKPVKRRIPIGIPPIPPRSTTPGGMATEG